MLYRSVKMKAKEHSKEIGEKGIDMQKIGKGYKIISKCLVIPVSAVETTIRKWKLHHTTRHCLDESGDQ